jgi:ribosomal protein L11 methyltransferase
MFELVLVAPEALVERLSDALADEFDAQSVSVDDAQAGSAGEQALFGEPGLPAPREAWPRSNLRALFASEALASRAATLLLAQDWVREVELVSLAGVADTDWVRATQAQFGPVEVTPELWVVPSWHEPPARARRVIRLDPGLAFGTGTHPTTRMCLRWIAHRAALRATPWPRVLDYGCGSGILAIGAALHGAAEVDAVDIDPAAVQATRANAAANAVRLRAGEPALATGTYALVLANILATPLKLLAPLLCAHVERSGALVLAGLLEHQADELIAVYAPWLDLAVADREDGWALLAGTRMAS